MLMVYTNYLCHLCHLWGMVDPIAVLILEIYIKTTWGTLDLFKILQ